MAQDDGQERTEEPTPKRLKEAREKGQIPRSRELNTAVLLLVGGISFLAMGGDLINGLLNLMRNSLSVDRADAFDTSAMARLFLDNVYDALVVLAPFLVVMVIAAMVAPLALGGWTFSALKFKGEKLSPIKGIARMFSWQAVMELVKALAKFVVVATVAALLLTQLIDDFIGLSAEPLHQAIAHAGSLLARSFLLVSAAMLIIAAVDVPFQLWQHNRQLKMTRQEIKDEMKDTEGKPEVKSRIRQLQRQLAERRMMEEVPKADVIVTNPTHFAVALIYDQGGKAAPVVIAKGADLIAARIREVGTKSHIPLLSAPPLARALYHSTEIGQEIPSGLYLAVAQVLAYVYQLKAAGKTGEKPPKSPKDLPIPDEFLRKDQSTE